MRILISLLIVLSFCQPLVAQSNYQALLNDIELKQNELRRSYLVGEEAASIKVAQDYLIGILIDKVFPSWYGTPWDFNGTSRIPGQGNIACGYFVTNVLTDVGFNIPRIKWAQSASEVFIKELCPEIKRFHNSKIEEVEKYLLASGDGIYLVGLDSHTGFITVRDGKIKFVHSNYYQPEEGVMEEDIHEGNPLSDSNYRVVGKLFSEEMIKKWLLQDAY